MASKFEAGGVYIRADVEESAFKKKLKEMSAKAAEMAENVNKSTEKISKSGFGKLSSALKGLGSSIAGLSAGFAALFAVKKIVSFTKEWEKLYKVQEQAETKLAQMMKNTGVYTKENFNEMKQYAAELQNISNYGDEFLMPIIADLSKAKLSTEQLKEATKAAVDLMAGGQSADMLSKVLEKPLEMSQSLRRMGILINQEELKSLSLEEQRAKILDEINKKYGGMAEALANPAEQLKNALGDLKEVLGSGVSKTLEPVYRYLTKIINSLQKIVKPIMNVVAKVSNLFTKLPGVQLLAKNFNAGLNRIGMIFEGIENILMPALRAIERIFDAINRVNDSVFFKPINNFYDKLTELFKDGTAKIRKEFDRFVYSDIISKVKNGTELSDKDNQLLEEIKRDKVARQALLDAIKVEMDIEDLKRPVAERVADMKGLPVFEGNTVEFDDETKENLDALIKAAEGLADSLDADSDTPWSSADSATPNYNNSYNALKELYDKIYDEWQQTAANLEKISLQDFIKKVNEMTSGVVDEFEKQRQELKDQAKAEYDKQLAEGKAENQEELDRAFSSIDKAIDQLQEKAFEDYKKAFDDKTINAIQKDLTEVEKIANNTKKLEKELNEAVKNGTVKGQQRVELENDIIAVLKNDLDKSAKGLSANIESAANSILNITSSDKIGEAMKDYRLSIETVSKNIKVLDEKIKKIGDDASALDKQKRKEYETTKTVLEGILTAAENNLKVAEHFADVMFEPLKELAEETTNSIGNINGGSVASFYSTNKKAKADIANYSAAADKTHKDTLAKIYDKNNGMTQEERTAAKLAADTKLKEAAATAEQMEATRKATATTEAFTLAMSLAADALNTAADSIANNLEAEGDSERAADVREGAQIVSDSINNFLQGFAQGGPIMGLVMMIIGWIKELLERMGKYLHSLEAIFVSVSKAFDLVASLISPIALALEVLLTPITLLTELLSTIADILTPIMELISDVINLFIKPFFSIVRTVFKPLVDAVKKMTSGMREALGIGGVEDIDYSAQYDEMIGGINAILNALNEEKAILERHRALTQKINETANELYALQKGDAEAEFEKGVLTELFKTRLAEIEANKLYKDTSVNLAEYQKVIKQNGDIDIQQGKKLLFQLEHSELDANDFYAGNTEKLKELLNSLIQYQQDEDDRAVRAANAYNAQKANNAELSKIAEDFAALPEPITNSAIFLDDIQKQQSALDNTLNAYADENKELLDKGNDINQGGLSNVSEDVESTDSSVNNLTKVLLAINGHAVTNVSDYIDQVNKEIAAAEKTKQANEYRKSIYAAAERKINAASDDEYYGNYKSGAKSKVSEYINGLSEDYILKNYSNLLIAAGSIDIWDVIKNTKQVTGWYLGSKSDTASYNASAIKDQLIDEIRKRVGYATGGWTGNVPIDKISGFVHGQEYVVKAPYAADYRPMLEAINEGRGSSIFGNQSALQNVNINIDSTIRANDPLSMINEWNKELRNRNLRLELKKV